jgi:5-oxoprolinase (ATP-hydrolysing) subunit B
MSFGIPNCTRFGESALVLSTAGASLPEQRHLWMVARVARSWPHICEAVVGAGNLTLLFDRREVEYDALEAAILGVWNGVAHVRDVARELTIPVRYGGDEGPDLPAVAQECRCHADAVIEMHASARYVVAFVGFLPGFAYLDGLPEPLQLPRLDRPRTHVPAGSVSIAGRYSAVYPLDSPGGWHLIGRTPLRMFDPVREPFALLAPGDVVRFVPQ